ncbi:MAG: acyl-[ACP]--phospholipid O-acyltransferase, partial [Proteobacteria bacterium]|nr:acyl-[ACP]--phospholipid O-acyltransferase [Pseudomonadota bacterium]
MLEKYFVRPIVTGLLRLFYRVEVRGLEHYRAAGDKVLIIANHVSYLDPLLIGAFMPEKPAFAINVYQAKKWYLAWLRWFIRLYELDPGKPLSMKSLIQDLRKGAKVVLFPEGRISTSGGIMKVYDGASLLVEKTGAAVLPIWVEGAQYTPLSRMRGKLRLRWFPKIRLTVLPAKQFADGEIAGSRDIYDIMTHTAFAATTMRHSFLDSLLEAASKHGPRKIVATDGITRDTLSYRQLLTKSFALSAALEGLLEGQSHVGMLLPTANGAMVVFTALHMLQKVPCMLNFSAGEANMLHACMLAQAKTIVTSRAFVEKAKLEEVVAALKQQHSVIFLEDLKPKITLEAKLIALYKARAPRCHLLQAMKQQHTSMPALVLYTSGSEGTPKGVVLSHSNVLSNVAQFAAILDLNGSDVLFNALPVFHSFGLVVGMLTPMLLGIRAVMYPSPVHYRVIPELVYDSDATIMLGTDTFYNGYARYAHPYDFWRVRLAVSGAEKVREPTR